MKHILTLCAGNICRSPIAAALPAREFPASRKSKDTCSP
jgi:protein-tyrosine-phosphatase